MAKLMIVEDNHVTRQALCRLFKQESNFQDIMEAVNGRQALDIIPANMPDIIITDIVMPQMDGLALTEKVRTQYPDIKIIILSAYEEFEYAKKALKHGVCDYITKPIDYEQLLECVKKVVDEKNRDDMIKEQVKRSIPAMKENFLIKLVERQEGDHLSMDDAKYLELNFGAPEYFCVILQIDDAESIKKMIKTEKYNVQLYKIIDIISYHLVSHPNWVFRNKYDHIIAIIGTDKDNDRLQYEAVLRILNNIRLEAEKKCRLTLSIGVGKIKQGIVNINVSFMEAKDVLEYRFSFGNNRLFNAYDLELPKQPGHVQYPMYIQEKLVSKVRLGITKDALAAVEELMKYLEKNNASEDYIKTVILVIVNRLYQTLLEHGFKIDALVDIQKNAFNLIQAFHSSLQLFEWFTTQIEKLCNDAGMKIINHHKVIVQRAVNFIDVNYMRNEIDLNMIAKEVNITSSYLSTMFKKETNENLSDYLLKVRMVKAEELICSQDMKISEISRKVGFSSQFYFSSCFKKYFGQSPAEYKKNQE
jgi:two-component system, response regulator YesN